MTLGVRMVPAVLAGPVVTLWAATWFERVVAPAAFEVELPIPDAVDSVVVAVRAQSCGPESSIPTRQPTIRADTAATRNA